MGIRALPWLLAIVGLAIPLVATDFAVWPLVVFWSLVLAAIWFAKPLQRASRPQRIALAAASLPLLLLLAVTFLGLYLIPAAAAWLLIELISPPVRFGRWIT